MLANNQETIQASWFLYTKDPLMKLIYASVIQYIDKKTIKHYLLNNSYNYGGKIAANKYLMHFCRNRCIYLNRRS